MCFITESFARFGPKSKTSHRTRSSPKSCDILRFLDERSECKPDSAQPSRDERSECKPDRAQPSRDERSECKPDRAQPSRVDGRTQPGLWRMPANTEGGRLCSLSGSMYFNSSRFSESA